MSYSPNPHKSSPPLLPLKEEFLQILDGQYDMTEMFTRFSQICGMSKLPVILMIDEVDSASSNQVFIDFLALLRRYYLSRAKNRPFIP